jgi:hypothetical protein
MFQQIQTFGQTQSQGTQCVQLLSFAFCVYAPLAIQESTLPPMQSNFLYTVAATCMTDVKVQVIEFVLKVTH